MKTSAATNRQGDRSIVWITPSIQKQFSKMVKDLKEKLNQPKLKI